MKQKYYLSIKGGTGTYAVLLAILSSILAGLVTSSNVQWSILFSISIGLLIIGIGLVAWLNNACIKYNEYYTDIKEYKNVEDRKNKALDKIAGDNYNYPKREGVGKEFEKKFNRRSFWALLLSLFGIIFVVFNNVQQAHPDSYPKAECTCTCGNNNQEPESMVLVDTLNYQPKECKQISVCKYELDTVSDVHQIKTIQETSGDSLGFVSEGKVSGIYTNWEGHVPDTND